MKKITIIIAFLSLFLIVFSINTSGQSLTGRIWQCQDSTNIRTRPVTFVFKSDSTYYQIETSFGGNVKISSLGNSYEEGTYTETKTSITLTRYIGDTKIPPVIYKINWINSTEFILPIGINKYHFAELGSEDDIFSPKYLIPYIRKEVFNKQRVDPCYESLVALINTENDRLKEEAISNSKLIRKSSLVGTIWQMQMGKDKEERGRLNNISFGDDGVMTKIAFNYANGSITGTGDESKSAYREEDGKILVFNENATYSRPLEIKWESENQLIIENYYYARFNSDKDVFSANYTKHFVQRMIENARPVYPAFLEIFAGYLRTVSGKTYDYVGDTTLVAPYKSFEFGSGSSGGRCRVYTNKLISMQLKDYKENQTSLFLNKSKIFSLQENRTTWEEKWDFEWVNSQEFILRKDGKSYRYAFKRITPEPSYEQ